MILCVWVSRGFCPKPLTENDVPKKSLDTSLIFNNLSPLDVSNIIAVQLELINEIITQPLTLNDQIPDKKKELT